MKNIINVTDANWESEVLNHDGLVMVDFWAEWCGPCRMIAPIVEQISNEVEDVKVCKLNVDENIATAHRYQISAIPTIIFFKDGKPVDQVIGFTSKDNLKSVINRHL
ncbi:thioredoxin [Anoxybacter fermentans]|uniref:Thioredoxin n=1 Tax=Anoxybacter fermentans TaxID=1323375 RepID=A0A3Q9HQB7_9FIRM|nr:thioredoxin [Anoxybacter fermentans]AZR73057.1 thioredoxin [Anoxybacter fermentans]